MSFPSPMMNKKTGKKYHKSRQQSGYTIQLRRMAQETQRKRQKKKAKKKKKEKRKETEEKNEKRRKFPPPGYVSTKTSAKMDST
jgi:hypothetical protein